MGDDNITSLVEFLEPEGDEVEVDEETGTIVKAEETEDESDKSTETPEEEPEPDETEKEDEEPADEDKEEEESDEEEKPDLQLSLAEQNDELRQILRQQRKDMTIMKSKLDRLGRKTIPKTDEEELFGEEESKETEQELSDIEIVQSELSQLAQIKAPVLETLVEMMELNPKYEDVVEVCSQNHFSDMFSQAGDAIADKEGIDPTLAAMQAELAVWRMPNPYKYMYDLIKKYHPSYNKPKEEEIKPKAEVKPKKTPTSLANVPGKSAADNKWTSVRIDEIPETELDKVPEDIYQKYLSGDLD